MAAAARVARVVIDSPLPQLDHLFDYAIPEELADAAVPGVRVRVPLRSAGRVADGYLVEVGAPDDAFEGTLSPIEAVVSPAQVLTPEVWRLARRLADRSAGTASDILRLAVPGRMVRVEKAWLASRPESSGEQMSPADADGDQMSPSAGAAGPVVPVRGYGERVLEDAVARDERIALRAIPRLVPLPDGTWVGEWAVTLAALAADCWRGGRSAIVAVPDHRDLEQLAAALAAVAPPEAVVRADAGQANADRYRGFLEALSGPRIVIGNRSVVYAPASRLGLLVVWEDSDPLHAEPLSPYVHTRDAALVRQELEGCALVLSGNIRSVEAQRLVELGWLRDVGPERALTPKIVLTANQQAPEPMARAARIPSTAWRTAREALDGSSGRPRGPVLVQVARPGYAPVIACANCGQAARCTYCKGPLHQTRAGAPPSCTVCGRLATDWQCEHCEHRRFRMVTVGSGRTAEELGRAFPGTRVILADGDHPVQRIGSAPALVVATRGAEPIAEGGYQAVLLLDGERMLARESLHVAEDCLRWWQSAAGLAAPGAPTVLVGVSGPLARDFATGRLVEFAHAELVDRRELRFPPAVRLASVTGAEATVTEVLEAVDASLLIDVLGPAPVEPDGASARRAGPDQVRAVLRFEYAHGGDVAAAVRAAVVKNATRRRRAPAGRPGYRPAPTLRVRFDDPEIL
ncbi:preprotein translocase subunit SecA [Leifsonia xyli]|uniref:primosomal protein N' family DNA-binding protein n=1 Tax=Leifsonia xyli TaxID=1575 RepID=UPI0007CDE374|nr:preprotein translocase subunit SecA [Leifsonia xyli]